MLNLVVMGDSYSAGNGAGDYEHNLAEVGGDEEAEKAYVSRNNWGYKYREWLLSKGVDARLTVLAHSGHTTEMLLNGQVAKLPNNTDMLLLTIGGNDIGFGQVAENCLAEFRRTPEGCKQAIESAREIIRDPGVEGLKERTKEVFTQVVKKLNEMKRYSVNIVLLGYPNLILPDSDWYKLSRCVSADGTRRGCTEWFTYNAGAEILKTAQELAKVQKEAVDEWNKLHPLYSSFPRYIDSVPEYFRGHENHASFYLVNTKRWINDFLETEGYELPNGNTHANFSGDMMEWIHPNKIGHAKIADVLVKELGIPRAARQSLPPEESPNAEPEAETEAREPISAWIQGSYAHPIGKPLRLDARGSYSDRGKITTYEWDLDGDGQFDETTTGPILTYTWTEEFVGKITLRVTSETGATATTTTDAMITNDGDSTPYARDNCPEAYNYGQTDYDKDGIGDTCDPTPGHPTEDQPGVIEGDPPAPSPSPSPSPSISPSATTSPSPSPSASPTRSSSPTPTRSPSATPSTTPSGTPSPSPSPSVTASPTPSASPSLSPSVEPSATAEPTASPSESGSPLPTVIPSTSPTEPSPSVTATEPTVTEPPTVNPDPTASPAPTGVPPALPSPTSTPSPMTPQPTTPVPTGVPDPRSPVRPDPGTRPRPGLPDTGR
ncbi:MAG: GDSL-type esterase/lipase family protein [Arachnia propionica]|uniref:GDSL-type esterase/lipase family protein n=1 Tax=Arachnia propionica TaxID=1750 RepID=UPI0026F8D2D4|nr:GDSL-type esterase/lipase family protein [Arachnia propionica]